MAGKTIVKKMGIIVLILFNVGCDQISKDMVRNKVLPMDYIEVLSDNLILTNVENTGAMLGFGQSLPPILKIIFLQALPVLVLVLILFRILKKTNQDIWVIIAFAFVVGGGMGNLMDRIAYGSVTDFFQIKLGILKTGIFNMADVSVTMGLTLIIILSLKHKKMHF